MRRITTLCISISVAFLLFATTGLSFAADKALIEAAKKEGELILYCSTNRRYTDLQANLFEKMYKLPDGFVKTTRKGTGALLQMIDAEQMTGKPRWDIVEQTGEDISNRWIDNGMLMKYQPPNIGNIRPVFRDKRGYRVPHHLGISSIAINTKRVQKEDWPTRYEDLLDPKWKGRLGISNPATAGPAVMFTRFMIELYGWDFFRKLGRNQPILTKGNASVELLLMRGEIDVGINPNEFSVLKRIAEGEKDLHVIYPEEGSGFYTQLDGINIVAPHPNAAKLWMEFICTDDYQLMYAEQAKALMPSQTITPTLKRPPGIKFYSIDWDWIKENRNEMVERFIKEIKAGMRETE